MNAPLFPPTMITPQHPAAAMPDEPVIPLSIEAYHALIQAGVFVDSDPYEFLEGFVVPKMPRGSRHELVRRRFVRQLNAIMTGNYFVDSQGAATLLNSEPEPDVFIIRGTEEDYPDRHAGPKDVMLVVEVADSSVRRDRNWKQRVYARAKVPCYWIANLVDDYIEALADPSGPDAQPSYRQRDVYRVGDELPVIIDGKEIGRIAVAAILGPAMA